MTGNPLRPIETERDAEKAARAGIVTAGWIILGYLAKICSMAFTARPDDNILWESAFLFATACVAVLAFLAAAVGWLIWSRQPLWASILILAWLVIGNSYQLVHGGVGIAGLAVTLVAAGCGILSVRGAFYRQQLGMRRDREAAGA